MKDDEKVDDSLKSSPDKITNKLNYFSDEEKD